MKTVGSFLSLADAKNDEPTGNHVPFYLVVLVLQPINLQFRSH